ncbi:MAG: gamma-glutamylcyclotransferase [Gammaproteobacteria bacterium]|jgi:hypothetical protein
MNGPTRLYYLAYGSNLHPVRLTNRVPSAELVATVALPGYATQFHKRGQDGSAKCNLVKAGPGRLAYAAVYTLLPGEKARLDAAEGLGRGYEEAVIEVSLGGTEIPGFVYLAAATHVAPALQPYHWYKRLVTTGARHHGFPGEYVAALEAVPSVADPDPERTRRHEALLLCMSELSGTAMGGA